MGNISRTYEEIFETYLNFCPYYRRNLIDLNDMYKWIEDIDLRRRFFSNKYDFFILMEWFNAIRLIKPLTVLSYPPERFKDTLFIIKTNSSELDQLYEDGLISFPEEIYDLNNKSPNEIKLWEYRVYKPEINDEKDYRRFTEYELDHYLYHPIQFFQLITYLRGSTYENLKNKKEYKKFYWKRRLNFNDSMVKEIEKYLKEKDLTKEQYIKQKSDKGIGFHQLEAIYFKQHRWLIEKALLTWIKFESLYHTKFLRPSNSREINIELQISLRDSTKEELIDNMFREYDKWYLEVMDNFSKYFTINEFSTLKGFIQWTEVQLDFDGLDNFKDLFLLINNEKKIKLKGFINYFVNMLQIVKTLRFFYDKFVKAFPELVNEKFEPKWYEPRYLFETEDERMEYIQKVYLDYGLSLKDTYLLYVEGSTEMILLEDWLYLVYSRTKVKVDVKRIYGKRDNIFKYLSKEFNAKEHFLILDGDKPGYAESKKNELKGRKISEDSFYIFSPDFITANFESEEIVEALKGYFNDISEKIYEGTGKRKILTESDLIEIRELLENKEEFDKYEDLVEKFLRFKLQNPTFRLKKTDFAQNLLYAMRKNLSQTNRSKKYLFEEVIGKFISRIQKKKYPGLDIDI